MTCGLVRTSYSLPKWQAVKLTFFAPWHQPRSQGSLLPAPMERERERDPGKRWSRGSRTKLFLREESWVDVTLLQPSPYSLWNGE